MSTDKDFVVKNGLQVEGNGWYATINSSGYFINAQPINSSGGYYKGNNGDVGDTAAKQNLYRINANTQSNNITIAAGENALTVGPMVIESGFNLTISPGGRAVII